MSVHGRVFPPLQINGEALGVSTSSSCESINSPGIGIGSLPPSSPITPAPAIPWKSSPTQRHKVLKRDHDIANRDYHHTQSANCSPNKQVRSLPIPHHDGDEPSTSSPVSECSSTIMSLSVTRANSRYEINSCLDHSNSGKITTLVDSRKTRKQSLIIGLYLNVAAFSISIYGMITSALILNLDLHQITVDNVPFTFSAYFHSGELHSEHGVEHMYWLGLGYNTCFKTGVILATCCGSAFVLCVIQVILLAMRYTGYAAITTKLLRIEFGLVILSFLLFVTGAASWVFCIQETRAIVHENFAVIFSAFDLPRVHLRYYIGLIGVCLLGMVGVVQQYIIVTKPLYQVRGSKNPAAPFIEQKHEKSSAAPKPPSSRTRARFDSDPLTRGPLIGISSFKQANVDCSLHLDIPPETERLGADLSSDRASQGSYEPTHASEFH